jgi:hypothetical protein
MKQTVIKKNVRLSPAMPQLVRDALGSRLMLAYVIASAVYYALLLVSNMAGGTDLLLALSMILAQGFVTAESMILYQRKESRNLRHLSAFCLIAMIIMFLLCLFLGMVVLTLNMEYSARTEEIMQLWAEADLGTGMPFMIVTVVSVGLSGLTLLFLWKALGMCADWLEHRGQARNWFLPAAIASALGAALTLAMTLLQAESIPGAAANLLSVIRDGLLAALLIQAAARYKARLG